MESKLTSSEIPGHYFSTKSSSSITDLGLTINPCSAPLAYSISVTQSSGCSEEEKSSRLWTPNKHSCFTRTTIVISGAKQSPGLVSSLSRAFSWSILFSTTVLPSACIPLIECMSTYHAVTARLEIQSSTFVLNYVLWPYTLIAVT